MGLEVAGQGGRPGVGGGGLGGRREELGDEDLGRFFLAMKTGLRTYLCPWLQLDQHILGSFSRRNLLPLPPLLLLLLVWPGPCAAGAGQVGGEVGGGGARPGRGAGGGTAPSPTPAPPSGPAPAPFTGPTLAPFTGPAPAPPPVRLGNTFTPTLSFASASTSP